LRDAAVLYQPVAFFHQLVKRGEELLLYIVLSNVRRRAARAGSILAFVLVVTPPYLTAVGLIVLVATPDLFAVKASALAASKLVEKYALLRHNKIATL
jgi:hypothetical protein